MKLTIKEKEYNLVWGLPAISQFCENLGHTDDLEKAFDIAFPINPSDYKILQTVKARLELVFAAVQVGCELENTQVDFTMMELQNFVDNADQKLIDSVFEDFFKSKYMGRSVEEYLFESVKEEDAPKEDKTVKKSRRASS
ncbi:MAG: hypothetical protein LBF27_25800 [Sphingobacterium sp.]|jgi:hypothetical protein|nr:hypothetical protein [Sphingobacterium sp.]